MEPTPASGIAWLSDLVRLEIRLWNRVDARLRAEHDLPLAYFWPLSAVGQASEARLRVGEIARALGLTVGGCSKIVDRIERLGFVERVADPADRRASLVVLTAGGQEILQAASTTYEQEMVDTLAGALTPDEQAQMHHMVRRLLEATPVGDASGTGTGTGTQARTHIAWDTR